MLGQDHSLKLSQDLLRLANEQAQPGGRRYIGIALDHRNFDHLRGLFARLLIQAWIEMRMTVSGSPSSQ
ncbi:hypothetical protein ACU4GI_21030 [Cupriavidus basilensis]